MTLLQQGTRTESPVRSQLIVSSDDVVRALQSTRTLALECTLSLVDQTKLVTAASELPAGSG